MQHGYRPRKKKEEAPGTRGRDMSGSAAGDFGDDIAPPPPRRKTYRAQPTLSALKTLGALRKGHRGYIEIDYELVEELAGNGLTQVEIAEALAISPGAVLDRLHGSRRDPGTGNPVGPDTDFAEAYRRGKAQMRRLISNGIFVKAQKGDSASLFFLAKTRMGWRENEQEKQQRDPAEIAALLRDEMAKAAA